jgi:hypothetical protein
MHSGGKPLFLTCSFSNSSILLISGIEQVRKRGLPPPLEAQIPHLFFFRSLRGMNKSGRGACPRFWRLRFLTCSFSGLLEE